MHSVLELENIIIRHCLILYNLVLACPLTFKLNFMSKWFHSNDQLHSKFFLFQAMAKNEKNKTNKKSLQIHKKIKKNKP